MIYQRPHIITNHQNKVFFQTNIKKHVLPEDPVICTTLFFFRKFRGAISTQLGPGQRLEIQKLLGPCPGLNCVEISVRSQPAG